MMAFVVNPGGAVHSVPDVWLETLMAQGFRPASDEEIAEYYRRQGLEVPGGSNNDGDSDRPRKKAGKRRRK